MTAEVADLSSNMEYINSTLIIEKILGLMKNGRTYRESYELVAIEYSLHDRDYGGLKEDLFMELIRDSKFIHELKNKISILLKSKRSFDSSFSDVISTFGLTDFLTMIDPYEITALKRKVGLEITNTKTQRVIGETNTGIAYVLGLDSREIPDFIIDNSDKISLKGFQKKNKRPHLFFLRKFFRHYSQDLNDSKLTYIWVRVEPDLKKKLMNEVNFGELYEDMKGKLFFVNKLNMTGLFSIYGLLKNENDTYNDLLLESLKEKYGNKSLLIISLFKKELDALKENLIKNVLDSLSHNLYSQLFNETISQRFSQFRSNEFDLIENGLKDPLEVMDLEERFYLETYKLLTSNSTFLNHTLINILHENGIKDHNIILNYSGFTDNLKQRLIDFLKQKIDIF